MLRPRGESEDVLEREAFPKVSVVGFGRRHEEKEPGTRAFRSEGRGHLPTGCSRGRWNPGDTAPPEKEETHDFEESNGREAIALKGG